MSDTWLSPGELCLSFANFSVGQCWDICIPHGALGYICAATGQESEDYAYTGIGSEDYTSQGSQDYSYTSGNMQTLLSVQQSI